MRKNYLYLLIIALLALPGCAGNDPATAVDGSEGPLVIYPDYKDVTIPANIAPLRTCSSISFSDSPMFFGPNAMSR